MGIIPRVLICKKLKRTAMKSILNFAINIVLLLLVVGLGSCKKYLDVVPKGQKIPTTLADFEALVRDEYTNHRAPVTQAVLLLNDRFETQSTINGNPLWKPNYM